jgi:hypothetical protein
LEKRDGIGDQEGKEDLENSLEQEAWKDVKTLSILFCPKHCRLSNSLNYAQKNLEDINNIFKSGEFVAVGYLFARG